MFPKHLLTVGMDTAPMEACVVPPPLEPAIPLWEVAGVLAYRNTEPAEPPVIVCPSCHGYCVVDGEPCEDCGGRGLLDEFREEDLVDPLLIDEARNVDDLPSALARAALRNAAAREAVFARLERYEEES
jgi:hypothetical protein